MVYGLTWILGRGHSNFLNQGLLLSCFYKYVCMKFGNFVAQFRDIFEFATSSLDLLQVFFLNLIQFQRKTDTDKTSLHCVPDFHDLLKIHLNFIWVKKQHAGIQKTLLTKNVHITQTQGPKEQILDSKDLLSRFL